MWAKIRHAAYIRYLWPDLRRTTNACGTCLKIKGQSTAESIRLHVGLDNACNLMKWLSATLPTRIVHASRARDKALLIQYVHADNVCSLMKIISVALQHVSNTRCIRPAGDERAMEYIH